MVRSRVCAKPLDWLFSQAYTPSNIWRIQVPVPWRATNLHNSKDDHLDLSHICYCETSIQETPRSRKWCIHLLFYFDIISPLKQDIPCHAVTQTWRRSLICLWMAWAIMLPVVSSKLTESDMILQWLCLISLGFWIVPSGILGFDACSTTLVATTSRKLSGLPLTVML